MDIAKIDKNLAEFEYETDAELTYYTLPAEGFSVHGVEYSEKDKRFERIPVDTANEISWGIFNLSRMLTGGRVVFSTDSDVLDLIVECQDCTFRLNNMPPFSACGMTLHEICDNGWWQFVHCFLPKSNDKFGYAFKQKLKGGKMRNYILHMSLFQDAKSIKIGLKKGSKVEVQRPYRTDVKPILYYGSSVTMGCCVSRADMTYQALISKWNNVDFINHGYSGNAKGEPKMAEYLAKHYDPSLFVCAYDYNAENYEFLRDTHYKFFETYRKGNPNVPILFLSRADTDSNPDGITGRREVILETLRRAKENGDNNVFYLDGREFFGFDDRDKCTIDDCHPNDLGSYRIAKVLYKKLIEINKKFK